MNLLKSLFFSLTMCVSTYTMASGIGLGATRVIYDEESAQSSLAIHNSDAHERFLIQAWVEDEGGNKTADFAVTPPLFTSSPKSENSLRIIYTGKPLPQDKETVYWLSVKAIPAVDKNSAKSRNTLQLAVLSRIKLFMRPHSIDMRSEDAPNHLIFKKENSKLIIENPTPYYISLVNLTVGGKKINNEMIAPKNNISVVLPSGVTGEVRYQTVNDYGAITASQLGKYQ
ncbi:fimbria/pilus periplasmic chaperone [Rosenbergiella sp. S61]|uniref:Fimbria/pilus periplasmic chaperone n=2 Tax=Rosenbergiella gaditana TaxID=2726987 RepID=A0ABS5SX72_9GAMM|nr:fimbria/pilus periplasmic chaperone [Rosenbergiella gaditana]MBT0724705.1 fimbria/pilus periplasmic chaperone [Rosenbergiella gaditana]